MKNLLIIITIILVSFLILLGTLGYWMIFRPVNASSGNPNNGEQAGNNPLREPILYDPGKVFITNVKGSNAFLRTEIRIEINDKKIQKTLEDNTFKVQDVLNGILREITEDDMKDQNICEILKKDIKNGLQKELKIDKIINIYLIEFVMQ